MLRICIYKGYGMYERDGIILHKLLSKYVCCKKFCVSYVTPEDILSGTLNKSTSLFVIGGGFDLGLIKVLGSSGMSKIKDYVTNGGSYLGICSGAYFACDNIEFDKGGPLEVIGERFLKFYPGRSCGPMYKPYDYTNRSGAVASLISFKPEFKVKSPNKRHISDTDNIHDASDGDGNNASQTKKKRQESDPEKIHDVSNDYGNNLTQSIKIGNVKQDVGEQTEIPRLFKVYFNGGGLFVGRNQHITLQLKQKVVTGKDQESQLNGKFHRNTKSQKDEQSHIKTESQPESMNQSNGNDTDLNGIGYENVTVLARYADLESTPAAIVRCKVGKGTAVLSGTHFEYDGEDIDDGDELVKYIVPELKNSQMSRKYLFLSILNDLNISTKESL